MLLNNFITRYTKINLNRCYLKTSLPYRLLICKLRAYGLSVNACELLKSYFCERKQRVKLGDKYSDWLGIRRCRVQNECQDMVNTKRSPTRFINGFFLGKKIFIVSKQKNRQKIQKIDISSPS